MTENVKLTSSTQTINWFASEVFTTNICQLFNPNYNSANYGLYGHNLKFHGKQSSAFEKQRINNLSYTLRSYFTIKANIDYECL